MHNSHTLISNYSAVELFQLRGSRYGEHPVESPLATYALEYYVDYTTLCTELRAHPGMKHSWHCIKDGFPSPDNLRKWVTKQEAIALAAGHEVLIMAAAIRRSSNGEFMLEMEF